MSAGKGKKSSSEAGAASPSATAPAKKATTKKATAGKEADGQAAGRKSREKASGRKPEKVTGAKGPQIPAAERTDAGVAERSPADGPASNPFREVMRRQSAPEPATLVIFGVSGDLARRKLLPAIFGLFQDGLLSSAVQILGVGRQEMLAGEFQSFVEQALRESSETDEIDEASLGAFLETLAYCAGDLAGPEVYGQIAALCSEHETSNALFYLSLPPSLFITVSDGLAAQGLHRQDEGWRRLVIEKPFGRDLESARDLQARLTRHWDESQIYRIDHYLGKETVQNLLAIRFGNAIFEPLWNRNLIDHVQITASEDLGLEGRAGYYEEAGAVRDMLQNHLLQLLALTAMEPPAPGSPDALRDEKAKVLQATRRITPETVDEVAVRGQYAAGTLYGERLAAYKDENGVDPDSRTATYVAVRLEVDNWRWQGVPFFLRTGKRLPKKVTEIAVVFKRPPLSIFPNVERNVLAFRIQPDEGVSLKISSKMPGQEMDLREVVMDFRYDAFGAPLESPYSRLLLDALTGDASLFPRAEEVMESWRIVQGLIDTWEGQGRPQLYTSGTWGPDDADRLMGEGRRWRRL
ncbi:glucose-6-phosphate 1-dehydrogenase [Deinococcus proteolyticus MRP]|uniref:Glucose-6-phosphate 1-dehydrogenase n=1 Tax=Deinococcus proteolyticus (strain ATCC 35074 / DSM 20540 / JCM 6276 / NBRC 101906 / NCIMB 13154 / VKM Ac-1939 / CCM 2703 / MRP) TaxID=693977 RepID=F0RK35_DEIPM|nr:MULTISPECIES: glucose-6-phosphate dehydrogenase [Deinococcus]ADY26681.1 glucose-6-phosphate 1-dehydrogenase [Deinococcus proteolyticus MRP]MCY1702809.1 glucose-6-phosphate dehydrogenase [Deinococcus sp. SL84]